MLEEEEEEEEEEVKVGSSHSKEQSQSNGLGERRPGWTPAMIHQADSAMFRGQLWQWSGWSSSWIEKQRTFCTLLSQEKWKNFGNSMLWKASFIHFGPSLSADWRILWRLWINSANLYNVYKLWVLVYLKWCSQWPQSASFRVEATFLFYSTSGGHWNHHHHDCTQCLSLSPFHKPLPPGPDPIGEKNRPRRRRAVDK